MQKALMIEVHFFKMEYEENKEIKICLNYPCTEF